MQPYQLLFPNSINNQLKDTDLCFTIIILQLQFDDLSVFYILQSVIVSYITFMTHIDIFEVVKSLSDDVAW